MEEKEYDLVHVRLPSQLVKEIDHLGVDWGTFRAETMARLLALGMSIKDAAATK